MKKLLLFLALFSTISLLFIACNDNKNNSENEGNSGNQVDDDNSLVDNSFETPDFSEKAGFKINVDDDLSKKLTYENIFLMNETTAQLDISFSDGTIGTLLVDTMSSMDLQNSENAELIDDIPVTIENGDDGINIYAWKKNDQLYSFYTNEDLKGTEKLKELIYGFTLEITD